MGRRWYSERPVASADVVICGAGMAGVAAAYHLAVRSGVRDVVLIDEREPLTLTSNKGTEAYRNWWPGPDDTMLRFMSRSIDLLEELAGQCDNEFQLNRRGYVFLTARPEEARRLEESAEAICTLGAGELRRQYEAHHSDGADWVTNPGIIRKNFPFITTDAIAMLHARRCGWLSAGRLGRWLLAQAQAVGVSVRRDRLQGVRLTGGRVEAVSLRSGEEIVTGTLVLAPGPYLKQAAGMLGVELPVFTERHGKAAFANPLGIIPRDAPLMIWNDPVGELPAGVHFRTREDDGKPVILIIWTYDVKPGEVIVPPVFEPEYAETLLRGLARMVPGLEAYFGQGGSAVVDGGYYCKTPENRPLIGPLPVTGAFVIGALSGFGVMGSQAAGELLAAQVTGTKLPDYAPAFLLSRYEDAAYRARLPVLVAAQGQL